MAPPITGAMHHNVAKDAQSLLAVESCICGTDYCNSEKPSISVPENEKCGAYVEVTTMGTTTKSKNISCSGEYCFTVRTLLNFFWLLILILILFPGFHKIQTRNHVLLPHLWMCLIHRWRPASRRARSNWMCHFHFGEFGSENVLQGDSFYVFSMSPFSSHGELRVHVNSGVRHAWERIRDLALPMRFCSL